MRRDARERREALITAAAACFTESGFGVALEEIADRAGVGRGTLYRNFKDRMAIAVAIFEREVDRLEGSLNPSLPLTQTIANLAWDGLSASSLFARLANELPLDEESFATFRTLGDRVKRLLDPIAERAQHTGELRAGLGGKELMLAVKMVGRLIHPGLPRNEVATELAEGIDLLLNGLRPR